MVAVTVNFHPYKRTKNGNSILQAFRQDPYLRSQYETRTSNGGLTAYQGGARWQWESRIFNQKYDAVRPEERPKYGALNYLNHRAGASPRFGSAYFCLRPEVLERTTFCYPDSCFNPEDFADYKGIDRLIRLADQHDGDLLDQYIEAHIHGQISLQDDVDCLVLDPVFKGTVIEAEAQRLAVDIEWHKGFLLNVAILDQHLDYRGEEYVALAKAIASADNAVESISGWECETDIGMKSAPTHTSDDGCLDYLKLAQAELSGQYPADAIKRVWHYLARFGNQN